MAYRPFREEVERVRRRTITEPVCIKIEEEEICTLRPHKIYLTDDDRGRLMDGREVVKIEGRWFYIPRR